MALCWARGHAHVPVTASGTEVSALVRPRVGVKYYAPGLRARRTDTLLCSGLVGAI
jgi:hypothetical protein